jgi:hypothetical protein
VDQNLIQISLAVISLVSVLGSSLLSYKTHKNKVAQKDKETELQYEQQFRADLLEMISDLQIRLKSLEESNSLLRKELQIAGQKIQELEDIIEEQFDTISVLGSFCKYIPAPVWVKKVLDDNTTRMFFINKFYEEAYGISSDYYVGKTDKEVWGDEIAAHFNIADSDVLRYKRGASFIENIPVDPFDLSKGSRQCVIWKFPILNNHNLIGIGGILIDIDNYILKKIH